VFWRGSERKGGIVRRIPVATGDTWRLEDSDGDEFRIGEFEMMALDEPAAKPAEAQPAQATNSAMDAIALARRYRDLLTLPDECLTIARFIQWVQEQRHQ